MKTLLIGCFMLMAACAYAQFEQGTMLVGGNVGFSSVTNKSKYGGTTTTDSKTTTIYVLPNFGYFVMDNLAVGAGLNLSTSTQKEDDGDGKYTTTSTQLVPFVRYYFQNFFGQGQFGFGSSKEKYSEDGSSEEYKYSTTSWALGIGYAKFLNDNVAIEPMIMYGSTSDKLKDSDPESVDITGGLSINVGLQIYLR